MIPDFKTYIGESVWADIHRRSNGEKIRKEDDIDNMSFDAFVDCWESKYVVIEKRGWKIPEYKKNPFNGMNYLITPVEYAKSSGFRYTYSVELDYDSKNNVIDGVRIQYFELFIQDYPYFQDILGNEYKINDDGLISVTSGEYKFHHYIDVIDKCLNMVTRPYIKKVVNESVWTDMHKRSNGELERREDNVDLLNPEDFTNYLIDRYKITDTSYDFYIERDHMNIIVPILARKLNSAFCFNLVFDEHNKIITLSKSISEEVVFSKIYEKLKNEYRLEWTHINGPKLQISPKKGDTTNSFFVNVIDFIIDNTSKNNLVIDRK